MVNFTGLASIDHQGDLGMLLVLHEMTMNTTARHEGRKGDPVCIVPQSERTMALMSSSTACNDLLQAHSRANL